MEIFMAQPDILSFLCELTGGYLKVYTMESQNIFVRLPPHLRTLEVCHNTLSYTDLPDLFHLTQVTSLDLTSWHGTSQLLLPSSLQELKLNHKYNQPLDLSHCTSLTTLTIGQCFASPFKSPPSLTTIYYSNGNLIVWTNTI
jgi:hypothetical protein